MKKCIILIFICMSVVFALDIPSDITGFRGFSWDTPYADMSDGLVKSSSMNPGFKGYEKPGDDMIFANLEAHTIIYLFKKDKFNCVSINYYNKQIDSLVTNLTAMYGEPKTTINPFLQNYEWYFPGSVMVLSYFVMNESDKSVALGIRKPK